MPFPSSSFHVLVINPHRQLNPCMCGRRPALSLFAHTSARTCTVVQLGEAGRCIRDTHMSAWCCGVSCPFLITDKIFLCSCKMSISATYKSHNPLQTVHKFGNSRSSSIVLQTELVCCRDTTFAKSLAILSILTCCSCRWTRRPHLKQHTCGRAVRYGILERRALPACYLRLMLRHACLLALFCVCRCHLSYPH